MQHVGFTNVPATILCDQMYDHIAQVNPTCQNNVNVTVWPGAQYFYYRPNVHIHQGAVLVFPFYVGYCSATGVAYQCISSIRK